MKRIIWFLTVSAVFYSSSCATKLKEQEEESSKYTATSPLKMDTSYVKDYVSQIRSIRNIEIRTQEKGFLETIYVDEGRFVKAGQLLFKIMPRFFEAELQKAEAEVRAAEIELQNSTALVDKNIVSKNEQAVAEAKLDQAKAVASLAKLHLSFTEIRAPFDGTIDRIPKKQGSLVDEGELLTTLSDNSQVFAYFNVSEPEYLNYQSKYKERTGNKVNLLLANNQQLPYQGEIETIESEFDHETGNIAFRAKFPNPERLLKNGETGKVLMTVPFKNALVIPQKATYEIQDKIFVYLIGKDDKLESRLIKIAGTLPDLYILESGLIESDKILLEGVQKVKEEEKVNVEFEQPVAVLAKLKLKAE